MTTRTYTYENINLDELTSIDLRDEVAALRANQDAANAMHKPNEYGDMHYVRAYRIHIDNEAESADALYATGRLGIAWGSDATWGDVPGSEAEDIEEAIHTWLNDGDAWEQRN